LSNANLKGAYLYHDNFTNANLSGAIGDPSSEGATFSNTTCPDGTNSDANGGTCVGHGFSS
jgi:uncharacterized protein YjbI with pentapeptide repeats